MSYTFDELFNAPSWAHLGYVVGLGRDFPHPKKSHLYRGTFDDPGEPLCHRGWNRDDGESYSIWRGQVGEDGICGHCINKARKEIAERANDDTSD